MKFNLKKLNKIIVIPGLVLSSLSIGIMQNVDDVNAYNYITTNSYNGLNSTNKAIIDNLHATYSMDTTMSGNLSHPESAEVIYATAGNISTSMEGQNNISGYQWTGWYDKNKKDFSIDKSVTGNFGTSRGSKTFNFSTDKTGYYKYLRDPIYSEIRLKATQQFTWVTKKKESPKNEYKQDDTTQAYYDYNGAANAINEILKSYSITDNLVPNYDISDVKNAKTNKIVNSAKNKLKNDTNSRYATVNLKWKGSSTKNSYFVKDHVVVDTDNEKTLLYGNIDVQVLRGATVTLSKPSKTSTKVTVTYNPVSYLQTTFFGFYSITYKNYSKNIQIANTVVARNVSATELSKYRTFYLVSNNGANTSNSTTVSKTSAGWWGRNHPSYHQGNGSTSDGGGWYTWRNDTSSGVRSVNLRNSIPEKEKEFKFTAVPSNIGKDNTSTLHINPNGGTYNGNAGETNVKQRVYTFYTVGSALRNGYTLTGWGYAGGGVWNPNTNKYQFNLVDGYLTAKWTDNNTIDNPDPNPGTDPTDPSNPTDPDPDNPNCTPGQNCQPGIDPTPNPNPNPDNSVKYTLKVDPNGGRFNGKTSVTSITKKKGSSAEVKNPTRSGYLFLEWEVVSGNSNYFSPGTETSMYKFYGNATLRAKWVKKKDNNSQASVTIDPNGGTYEGSSSTKTITGTPGTSTVIKTPVRDGYIFKGWEISNIDKNKYESPTFTFVRGNTIMKAKWEKPQIPACTIGSTGEDSCGDNSATAPGIWVHLNKDIFSK